MGGYRPQRLAEEVHQILVEVLMYGVKDPRVVDVTVTAVDVAPDLQLARVFYTVDGDAAERRQAAEGLKSVTPYLRHTLAEEVRLRQIPELRFIYDESLERGQRIDSLLRQALPAEPADDREDQDDH